VLRAAWCNRPDTGWKHKVRSHRLCPRHTAVRGSAVQCSFCSKTPRTVLTADRSHAHPVYCRLSSQQEARLLKQGRVTFIAPSSSWTKQASHEEFTYVPGTFQHTSWGEIYKRNLTVTRGLERSNWRAQSEWPLVTSRDKNSATLVIASQHIHKNCEWIWTSNSTADALNGFSRNSWVTICYWPVLVKRWLQMARQDHVCAVSLSVHET
jgi:hypothetical protein